MTNFESPQSNNALPERDFAQDAGSDILNADAVQLTRPVETNIHMPVIEEPTDKVRLAHPNSFPRPREWSPADQPVYDGSAPGYEAKPTDMIDMNKARVARSTPKILRNLAALPQPPLSPAEAAPREARQPAAWIQTIDKVNGRPSQVRPNPSPERTPVAPEATPINRPSEETPLWIRVNDRNNLFKR